MTAQAKQYALDFGANEAARGVNAAVLDAVREIIATATLKQVAYDLDVSPSTLSDAIGGRENRDVKLSWLPTILARANDAQRATLLAALADPFGYELARKKVLTAEERLARLEQALRSRLGEVGETLIKEVGR